MAEDISKKLKDAPTKNEIKLVHRKDQGYNKVDLYTSIKVFGKYKSDSNVNLEKDKNHFKGYNEIKV